MSVNDKEPNSYRNLKEVSENKIFLAVSKIEKDYMKLSNLVIRDLAFNEFELKIVAAASVAFLRKVSGFTPVWNIHL